jgi:hypothetical protein
MVALPEITGKGRPLMNRFSRLISGLLVCASYAPHASDAAQAADSISVMNCGEHDVVFFIRQSKSDKPWTVSNVPPGKVGRVLLTSSGTFDIVIRDVVDRGRFTDHYSYDNNLRGMCAGGCGPGTTIPFTRVVTLVAVPEVKCREPEPIVEYKWVAEARESNETWSIGGAGGQLRINVPQVYGSGDQYDPNWEPKLPKRKK